MQGLWKSNVKKWTKDCKRKNVSRHQFIKGKKSIYHKIAFKSESTILPDNVWIPENEHGKKEMFYGKPTHPMIACILFGSQFSKKPYKKIQHKRGRAKEKSQLNKTLAEYKDTYALLDLSLEGTYGMDPFFYVSDSVVDLDFDTVKSIDLDID